MFEPRFKGRLALTWKTPSLPPFHVSPHAALIEARAALIEARAGSAWGPRGVHVERPCEGYVAF